jgi:hypothetical protein
LKAGRAGLCLAGLELGQALLNFLNLKGLAAYLQDRAARAHPGAVTRATFGGDFFKRSGRRARRLAQHQGASLKRFLGALPDRFSDVGPASEPSTTVVRKSRPLGRVLDRRPLGNRVNEAKLSNGERLGIAGRIWAL